MTWYPWLSANRSAYSINNLAYLLDLNSPDECIIVQWKYAVKRIAHERSAHAHPVYYQRVMVTGQLIRFL